MMRAWLGVAFVLAANLVAPIGADLSAVARLIPASFGETAPKLREGGKVGTTDVARADDLVSADVIHLDAVVTDRKQRPIRDLSAGDFEISESGEPRTIESVRLQSGGRRVVAIF